MRMIFIKLTSDANPKYELLVNLDNVASIMSQGTGSRLTYNTGQQAGVSVRESPSQVMEIAQGAAGNEARWII
jgi:hypothetical protein